MIVVEWMQKNTVGLLLLVLLFRLCVLYCSVSEAE